MTLERISFVRNWTINL